MYYIEEQIKFLNGVKEKVLSLHTIGVLNIDYINNEIQLQLASFASRQDWKDDNVGNICGFTFKYEIEDFDVDPHLVALRQLVLDPESIFYKKEIKKCYDINSFVRGKN